MSQPIEQASDLTRDQVHGQTPSWAGLPSFVRQCRRFRYSPHADILFLFPDTLEPGPTVEPGGCLAYRISHDKTRIVAIELHNFKAVFLRERPQVARAWREYASPWGRWLRLSDRAKRFLLTKITAFVEACADKGDRQFVHI